MRKEDLKNWTREQMVLKIISLYSSEEVLKKETERMAKCIASREEKIAELIAEIDELKSRQHERTMSFDLDASILAKAVIVKENEFKSRCEELEEENYALKQHIEDMEDVCDGSCFSDYEDLPFGDDEDEKDELIEKLQDQHQRDCIRYNDMRTAYLATLDELVKLREQFGVGK